MDNALVSVILPVFNAEEYLERCIDSILKQTYQNLELIVVNDGSTDDSEKICKKYVEMDSRVKYIFQENGGPSVARNKGIELASGEYIQFIDSDDYLESDCIEVLVDNVKGSDLVIAGYNNILYTGRKFSVQPNTTGLFSKSDFLNIFHQLLENQLFHYMWHKLYKRKIVSQIRFRDNVRIGEDLLFNLDYIDHIRNVSLINKIVYNHIWYNQNSITKKYHDNLFLTRKLLHENLIFFLKKNSKYFGDNRNTIEELYVRRIIACLLNINKKSSPLSFTQRINEIKFIGDDKTVKDIMWRFKNKKVTVRIFGMLLQKRKPIVLLMYSILILFVNNIRSSLLKVLKK